MLLLEPLSRPGLSFPLFLVTFSITLLVGAGSLVLVPGRPGARWRLVAWLLHPLAAVALTLLFLFSQSPANPLFRLRFLLSRAALDRAAAAALASPPTTAPGWIGLFRVGRVESDPPRQVRYLTGGCGVIDECGLLYRPGPPPERRGKTRLKPLGGPWYHLYAVF